MIGRFSIPPRMIGIDVGRKSVKAVQISQLEGGPRLDGVVCLARTGDGMTLDASEARRLVRTMDRRDMTATRMVLVAPTDALVGGSISLPPADSNVSRDQIVQMELSRTHKLLASDFEFAWWDLPVTAGGSRVGQAHAVALPHDAVYGTLDVLGQFGLHTVRTVPTSLALLAAAQRKPIDPRQIAAVLDLGSARAHLVLMYAGRVVHERALPDFNLGALRDQLVETMGVDDAIAKHALGHYGLRDEPDGTVACETTSLLTEAIGPLTEEIGMSFAYVSHLYPEAELGALLLAGGGANLPGLSIRISQSLELEAGVLAPDALIGGECFSAECSDPSVAAALGAALMGVS